MADEKQGCESPASKQNIDEQVKHVVVRVLRVTGAALSIWLLGWFNFHYSWVLIGISIYLIWKWKKDIKKERMESLREVTRDEKKALMKLHCMPSWVFFPDVQRAEWVNQMISQLWPFLNEMVRKILKEKVEPMLQSKLPKVLNSLYFEQIDLGSKNLKVGGVKVYTAEIDRTEIILDVDVIYAGDAQVSVKVKGICAGISDVQLRGKLRVELKPLLPVSPLIGGISIYFIDCPEIDFDLTNLLNVLDIPGLSDILRLAVLETLCSFMVLPNRINIPLSDDDRVESLKFPLPDGVLKVEVIEAADLVARDINVFSKNSSDPYVTVKVGTSTFKTKTIENDLAPVWKESFETFVDSIQGTRVYFHVFDSDAGSQDEFLGSADISLESVVKMGMSDMWLPLHKVPSGKIHVKCTWYAFSEDKDDIAEGQRDDESVAALFVKLDSAENLPETDTVQGTCNASCNITVGNQSRKSTLVKNTKKPVWEEVFRFMIYNPKFQELEITVVDEEEEKKLGRIDFNVDRLLQEPKMRLKQPFPLKEALPGSILNLIVELKALKTIKQKRGVEENKTTDSENGELRRRTTAKYPELEACIWYDVSKNKLRCYLSKMRYIPFELESKELKINLRLLPDKTPAGLRETKAFTSNTDIDEKFNYFISYEDVTKRELEIVLEHIETKAIIAESVMDLTDENLVNPETKWFKLKTK